MPEYLAPGVYVEETSFRAKSIEGVSTSTTGFVGPTRKGPIRGTPELITNFGDFERIYGGLANLDFGGTKTVNYLAHAVRAYFGEGGKRLYVARVYLAPSSGTGLATHSGWLVGSGTAATSARFVTRFPGRGGNGRLELIRKSADATKKTLEAAPKGSLTCFGGASPVLPASVTGSKALPLSLADGDQLLLTVGGTEGSVTVKGQAAELTADTALAASVTIDATDDTLGVTIDGGTAQTITLTQASYTPAELAAELNEQIRGGYARLTGSDELVIGSDGRGSKASVVLGAAHTDLGFTGTDLSESNTADANNNVADLAAVTAAEIDALLPTGVDAKASSTGNLELRTTATGATATLEVRTGTDSGFGLTVGSTTGTAGAALTWYRKTATGWQDASGNAPSGYSALADTAAPTGGAQIKTFNIVAEDADENLVLYEDLGFDAAHPRFVGNVLAEKPSRSLDRLENLYAAEIGASVTAFQLHDGLFGSGTSLTLTFSGGSDGLEPTEAAYKKALKRLAKLENISIVAAPGSSALSDAAAIRSALIAHAERRRAYRVAVLDARPDDLTTSSVKLDRARFDSKYAAFYHPWVVVSNPLARPGDESEPRELTLPPSGFLCGIYARNDVERGVFKAPANEVVRGALRFATDINFAEQEVLNPAGVNCLRFFDGRGYRVWGARTLSSDPEWKYVNVRRYFIFLEQSIDLGTQWSVFEPNGPRLWANVRETISGFLYNEWRSGALLGANPEEAFFVRCDRSTMTQNDLDNGRLICEIGVAVLKPAEFVIFRIGQKTADART